MTAPRGLYRGLTNYGDSDFAQFLRRSFARSMPSSTRGARAARDGCLALGSNNNSSCCRIVLVYVSPMFFSVFRLYVYHASTLLSVVLSCFHLFCVCVFSLPL